MTQVATRGKSAYAIAQEYGYTGTVEEWIDSLNGKSASVSVGVVKQEGNTLTIINSGTNQNAVLDFTFPASPLLDFLENKNGENLLLNGNFDIKNDGTNPDKWTMHDNGQIYQTVPNMTTGKYTLWWDGGDKGFWSNSDSPIIIDHTQSEDLTGLILVPTTAKRVVLLRGDWITDYNLPNPWNLVKRPIELEDELCNPKDVVIDDSNYAKLDANNTFTGSINLSKPSTQIYTSLGASPIYTKGYNSIIYTSGIESHICTRGSSNSHIMVGVTTISNDPSQVKTDKKNGRFIGDGAYIRNYDIGSLKAFLTNVVPENYIRPNGTLLNRADYPALWEFANASGMIVSDADWQDAAKQNWGKWSTGDGSTTFRTPLLDGMFLRILDNSRVQGSYQGDAIRNITGSVGWILSTNSVTNQGSGAMKWVSLASSSLSVATGNGSYDGISFDASRQVPTANENRPHNIAYNWFIRAI